MEHGGHRRTRFKVVQDCGVGSVDVGVRVSVSVSVVIGVPASVMASW